MSLQLIFSEYIPVYIYKSKKLKPDNKPNTIIIYWDDKSQNKGFPWALPILPTPCYLRLGKAYQIYTFK